MVNNSTKPIYQYKQNKRKFKQCLNSDGQQFNQYKQNKRKYKQWWSTIQPISTKQKKV